MIKKLWDNLNHKWYRSQYRKASNACLIISYVALVVLCILCTTIITINILGGIIIWDVWGTIVTGVLMACMLIMVVCITISMVLSVVDDYERKLSEGK
jgi:hypothetical protein